MILLGEELSLAWIGSSTAVMPRSFRTRRRGCEASVGPRRAAARALPACFVALTRDLVDYSRVSQGVRGRTRTRIRPRPSAACTARSRGRVASVPDGQVVVYAKRTPPASGPHAVHASAVGVQKQELLCELCQILRRPSHVPKSNGSQRARAVIRGCGVLVARSGPEAKRVSAPAFVKDTYPRRKQFRVRSRAEVRSPDG